MQDNTQLSHAEHKPTNKKFPLHIIANDINSPQNIGSLFRLCDALGVEKLYLCGSTPTPPNSKINKTARSTEQHVNFETHHEVEILINNLRTRGFFIISLEITANSIAIDSKEFNEAINNLNPNNKKSICLILGSENTGVDKNLLALSDITTHIKMHGNNSSMNVISAASIACYEIIKGL